MDFLLKKSDRFILVVGICIGCIAVAHPYLESFLSSGPPKGNLKSISGKSIHLEDVKVKLPEIIKGQSNIRINLAGPEKLAELPGIGPVLADRIVKYREESGKFTSVEELTEVSGIGSSKLGQLKELVKL